VRDPAGRKRLMSAPRIKIFCSGIFRAPAAGPLSQAFRLAPRRRGGLELEVLGLNIGIDAAVPALKLPAIGRLRCCDPSLLFDRV
jgi:hypothetical protein